ncbi:MAG: DUF1569 domain-containing protein [Flavobacterium sp.]|jgi:hypothetical protein
MKSIFNPEDNQEIIDRINKLNSNSEAKWGKMNVSQMLKHCQAPIDLAIGTIELQPNFIIRLIGKYFKNMIIKKEFQKNSPTIPHFIFKSEYDFIESKQELIEKVEKFALNGTSIIKNQKHPIFGKLTYQEWDILQWKHLNHHLNQFGV